MLFPLLHDNRDEEIKVLASKVSFICYSEEFQSLRRELEHIYRESGMLDVTISAFRDALYTLLIQDEDTSQIRCYGY